MVSIALEVVAADALDASARAEIVDLCSAAYGEDFSRLFEEFAGSVHVLARDESGALVGHAEWVTRWLQPSGHPLLRTAYVEAVATAPARQGHGFATAVLRRMADALAADSTWDLAALSPSDPAFYARLGWELWQGPPGDPPRPQRRADSSRRAGDDLPAPANAPVAIAHAPADRRMAPGRGVVKSGVVLVQPNFSLHMQDATTGRQRAARRAAQPLPIGSETSPRR
jgi:aminoglycoside 2'-N-acetyltransferase I